MQILDSYFAQKYRYACCCGTRSAFVNFQHPPLLKVRLDTILKVPIPFAQRWECLLPFATCIILSIHRNPLAGAPIRIYFKTQTESVIPVLMSSAGKVGTDSDDQTSFGG